MSLFSPFSRWFTRIRNPHEPLISVNLSREAMLHNLREFQKLSPAVAPVLKSNAYGHGLLEVAAILKSSPEYNKLPFIIIDSYIEARALRAAGFSIPLLIIGYTPVETILKSKLKDVSFAIISFDALIEYAEHIKKPSKIHLKVDTGMCRQGIAKNHIQEAITKIQGNKNLILEGLCSHFADADNLDSTFTKQQISNWNTYVELFKKNFPSLKYFHTSNTPGHAFSKEIQSNMSRLGFGLYGISGHGALDAIVQLKPVMSVTAYVSGVKQIEKGARIGYAGTYTAPRPMKIATIPMGYYEGIDRELSNKAQFKIGDKFVPTVGRISMNITVVDVTDIPDVKLGTPVIIVSNNENDPNSFLNLSKLCNTVAYELVVRISPFLQRVIY